MDTTPRPGTHRRRSLWLNGKFLALFLVVACLLGGGTLAALSDKQQANAANDGRDIQWGIGAGASGASSYSAMLNQVRQRATGGQVLREGTLQTPNEGNDFFTVDIAVAPESGPPANPANNPSIRLLIRSSDMFVVGWYAQNRNTFIALEDNLPTFNDPAAATPATQVRARFTGNYTDLERRAGAGRDTINLSPDAVRQAVRNLADGTATETDQAKALIVLIQVIAEAARFNPIEQQFRNTYTAGATIPQTRHLTLHTNWSAVSRLLFQLNDNPATVIPTQVQDLMNQFNVTSPFLLLALVLGAEALSL